MLTIVFFTELNVAIFTLIIFIELVLVVLPYTRTCTRILNVVFIIIFVTGFTSFAVVIIAQVFIVVVLASVFV